MAIGGNQLDIHLKLKPLPIANGSQGWSLARKLAHDHGHPARFAGGLSINWWYEIHI